MRCLEPDKDGHIMIHLLFSKLPFFRPYAMFLFNFPEYPHANEHTVRPARGGNEDLGVWGLMNIKIKLP